MNTRAFLIGGLLTAVLLISSCSKSYSNEWVQYVRSNSISDTSNDKQQNISQPFQIYKGKMYINDIDLFKQIDLKEGVVKTIKNKLGDSFFIKNDYIYFLDSQEEPQISYCKLTDGKRISRYWNKIDSMLWTQNELIGLRVEDNTSMILKYDGEEERTILTYPTNLNVNQLVGFYEDTYYLLGVNKLYKVSKAVPKLSEIFSIKESDPYSFMILEVRYIDGHIFVLGTVIDTSSSSLGGLFYVEDAESTGVWDISLSNLKKKKISDTLFDNLYVYNNCLYGILDDTYVTLDTEANN